MQSSFLLDGAQEENDWQMFMQSFINGDFATVSFDEGSTIIETYIYGEILKLSKTKLEDLTIEAIENDSSAYEYAVEFEIITVNDDEEWEGIAYGSQEIVFMYIQPLIREKADHESLQYHLGP